MWVLIRYVKVRAHERGLLFRDRDFVGVLRPGRHFIWDPLARTRVDVVSTRQVWLGHKDLDVIARSEGSWHLVIALRVQTTREVFNDSNVGTVRPLQ